jgi:hypothetical protein
MRATPSNVATVRRRRRAVAVVLAVIGGLCLSTPAAHALPDRASTPLRSSEPDLVLKGTFTAKDLLTYQEVPFVVPSGVVRVSVDLSYTQREKHTVIDLGVFDSERFRGWSGSNKDSVTLSDSDATPSYLPGAIHPGRWKLSLFVAALRPEVRTDYQARIYFWRHGDIPAVSTFSAVPLKTGARWYRGDMHMHTAHSDGSCPSLSGQAAPCPLYRTVDAAVKHGLDFIAMSDHNTDSHFNEMRELQPYDDTILLIPAREITTSQGHANVYGTTEFIDYRLGSAAVPNIDGLLRQVQDLHAIISINHPSSPTDETCRGCGWSAANTDYGKVQGIEALNAGELFGVSRATEPGVSFWQNLLNQGYRLTGLGGSDNHNLALGRLGVGYPTTVVYAPELSERAILDGVRAGHVFIDTQGSEDRVLEMTASVGGAKAMMGDALTAPKGSKLQVAIHVTHAKGGTVTLIEDGTSLRWPADPAVGLDDETKTIEMEGDGARHWIRADVWVDGKLALIGNPIYLNVASR